MITKTAKTQLNLKEEIISYNSIPCLLGEVWWEISVVWSIVYVFLPKKMSLFSSCCPGIQRCPNERLLDQAEHLHDPATHNPSSTLALSWSYQVTIKQRSTVNFASPSLGTNKNPQLTLHYHWLNHRLQNYTRAADNYRIQNKRQTVAYQKCLLTTLYLLNVHNNIWPNNWEKHFHLLQHFPRCRTN